MRPRRALWGSNRTPPKRATHLPVPAAPAALSLLREAHSRAPTHAKARLAAALPASLPLMRARPAQAAETLGSALAEFGDPEEAVCALLSAVSLSPEDGFEKHMYLGQLLAGADGIAHYRRGVELLEEAASKRCVSKQRGAHTLVSRVCVPRSQAQRGESRRAVSGAVLSGGGAAV